MNEMPFALRRRPCSAAGAAAPLPCPWRRDTAGTVPMPARLATEDFRQFCGTPEQPAMPDSGMFICHKSIMGDYDEDHGARPVVCAGWLAAVGRHHLGVRMLAMSGLIPLEYLKTPPGGPPLFESFDELVAGHTFIDR